MAPVMAARSEGSRAAVFGQDRGRQRLNAELASAARCDPKDTRKDSTDYCRTKLTTDDPAGDLPAVIPPLAVDRTMVDV